MSRVLGSVRFAALALAFALAAIGSGCSGEEAAAPNASPRTTDPGPPSADAAEQAIRADSRFNAPGRPILTVDHCASEASRTTCGIDYDDDCAVASVTSVAGTLTVALPREAHYCLHSAGAVVNESP